MNSASQISDQIANPHLQGAGESYQRMNADGLLSTLDFPDVNRMQVGFFSQLLLGKPRSFAVLADGFSDKLSLFWRCRHATLGKQEGPSIDTVYNPLFYSCAFRLESVESAMLEGKPVTLIRSMRKCRSGSYLRLPGQRAAGNCFPSFPARQIPRERTLLPRPTQLLAVASKAWRAGRSDERQGLRRSSRAYQSWRPFRPAQSLQHNYGEGLPFRPISPGSFRHSCDMSGWFHPRFSDVSACRPLLGTEAGTMKFNHRLKTVFLGLHFCWTGCRTGACRIEKFLKRWRFLDCISRRGGYPAQRAD